MVYNFFLIVWFKQLLVVKKVENATNYQCVLYSLSFSLSLSLSLYMYILYIYIYIYIYIYVTKVTWCLCCSLFLSHSPGRSHGAAVAAPGCPTVLGTEPIDAGVVDNRPGLFGMGSLGLSTTRWHTFSGAPEFIAPAKYWSPTHYHDNSSLQCQLIITNQEEYVKPIS